MSKTITTALATAFGDSHLGAARTVPVCAALAVSKPLAQSLAPKALGELATSRPLLRVMKLAAPATLGTFAAKIKLGVCFANNDTDAENLNFNKWSVRTLRSEMLDFIEQAKKKLREATTANDNNNIIPQITSLDITVAGFIAFQIPELVSDVVCQHPLLATQAFSEFHFTRFESTREIAGDKDTFSRIYVQLIRNHPSLALRRFVALQLLVNRKALFDGVEAGHTSVSNNSTTRCKKGSVDEFEERVWNMEGFVDTVVGDIVTSYERLREKVNKHNSNNINSNNKSIFRYVIDDPAKNIYKTRPSSRFYLADGNANLDDDIKHLYRFMQLFRVFGVSRRIDASDKDKAQHYKTILARLVPILTALLFDAVDTLGSISNNNNNNNGTKKNDTSELMSELLDHNRSASGFLMYGVVWMFLALIDDRDTETIEFRKLYRELNNNNKDSNTGRPRSLVSGIVALLRLIPPHVRNDTSRKRYRVLASDEHNPTPLHHSLLYPTFRVVMNLVTFCDETEKESHFHHCFVELKIVSVITRFLTVDSIVSNTNSNSTSRVRQIEQFPLPPATAAEMLADKDSILFFLEEEQAAEAAKQSQQQDQLKAALEARRNQHLAWAKRLQRYATTLLKDRERRYAKMHDALRDLHRETKRTPLRAKKQSVANNDDDDSSSTTASTSSSSSSSSSSPSSSDFSLSESDSDDSDTAKQKLKAKIAKKRKRRAVVAKKQADNDDDDSEEQKHDDSELDEADTEEQENFLAGWSIHYWLSSQSSHGGRSFVDGLIVPTVFGDNDKNSSGNSDNSSALLPHLINSAYRRWHVQLQKCNATDDFSNPVALQSILALVQYFRIPLRDISEMPVALVSSRQLVHDHKDLLAAVDPWDAAKAAASESTTANVNNDKEDKKQNKSDSSSDSSDDDGDEEEKKKKTQNKKEDQGEDKEEKQKTAEEVAAEAQRKREQQEKEHNDKFKSSNVLFLNHNSNNGNSSLQQQQPFDYTLGDKCFQKMVDDGVCEFLVWCLFRLIREQEDEVRQSLVEIAQRLVSALFILHRYELWMRWRQNQQQQQTQQPIDGKDDSRIVVLLRSVLRAFPLDVLVLPRWFMTTKLKEAEGKYTPSATRAIVFELMQLVKYDAKDVCKVWNGDE